MNRVGHARILIADFHAGRITRQRLAEGLAALYADELAAPLAPDGLAPGGAPFGLPVSTAPGVWLLLMSDTCHFCGRRGLPVLALSAGEGEDGVQLCLDDLERIRGEARAVLDGAGPGREEGDTPARA